MPAQAMGQDNVETLRPKRKHNILRHRFVTAQELQLDPDDRIPSYFVNEWCITRVRKLIQQLPINCSDYKILSRIAENMPNAQVAAELGWSSQFFSDYFSDLCKKISIPQRDFNCRRQKGIFRRIVIQKAFLQMEEIQRKLLRTAKR
jgi:hypothetical protein